MACESLRCRSPDNRAGFAGDVEDECFDARVVAIDVLDTAARNKLGRDCQAASRRFTNTFNP